MLMGVVRLSCHDGASHRVMRLFTKMEAREVVTPRERNLRQREESLLSRRAQDRVRSFENFVFDRQGKILHSSNNNALFIHQVRN